MSIKDTVLSSSPDLTKIIKKAVNRIGENHSLARDNKGVTMRAKEIEKDRKEFRNKKVIEESLKAAADEMAEKMVLENTIDGMIKEVMTEGEEEMDEQFKEMGQDVKKFWKWFKKVAFGADKVSFKVTWPKLPRSIRKIFLKRYKKKYRNCTFASCPDFDKLENNIKKTELAALETGGEDVTAMNETTTELIKKLVNKKLKDKLNEAKKSHPGYDTYEKAVKKSKTENDKAMKASVKKFKEYQDFDGNTKPEFPHQEDSKTDPDNIGYQYYRNNDDDQEFIDDFAHPGLIDFDINNLNMERLTDYLEGSSETGNAQEDEDGETLGNVVKSELGKKMKKSAERRKEKIAANKASMTNLRGYTPDVQKVKQVKEEVTVDLDNMKKLWNYNKITQ